MKADETTFAKFLNNSQQFVIPIYQRTYSWGISHCRQLWDDTVNVTIRENKNHFIGSIVYVSDGLYTNAEVHNYLVIDGQQRLTTLSLFFLALRDSLKEGDSIFEDQIMKQYLINEYADDNKKLKLVLTQADKVIYEKILNKQELTDSQKRSNVWCNYFYLKEQIETSNLDTAKLYMGISKLLVVGIVLDRGHDNPQLIFESLNSTGLDLSQSDLIRNYVLMGLDNELQSKIFSQYWLPMEELFAENKNESKFDNFMRSYLTLKLNSIPKIGDVYKTFKQFAFDRDPEKLLNDVYKYAKYYSCIELGKENDKQLWQLFELIKKLRVEVSHPFLLLVYDDYVNEVISKEIYVDILKMIESHIFRRLICGVPTNSLNKTFASLYEKIDPNNYLESLYATMLLQDGYRRFPLDNEFENEIIVKDIYNLRNSKYLLQKIESYLNKGRTELRDEKLSIEHIMPQTLTDEWKEMLGPEYKRIHDTYLHSLGNLTLTGFNEPMGNKSFKEKQERGFKNSGIFMNQYLLEKDEWNEQEINIRAQKLSKLALEIWKAPELDEDVLKKYNKTDHKNGSEYSIENFRFLKGVNLVLFNKLREKILALDSDLVYEEIKKLYIAYKAKTNFVDIVPCEDKLKLVINMRYNDINDPKGICRNIEKIGKWGNGDVDVSIFSEDQIDYVMSLIKQSFDKQKNK